MSLSPSIVLAFDVWIVLVLARRARDLLFVWPLERRVATLVAERGVGALSILAEQGRAAWAVLARAVVAVEGDEAGDRIVALEDALGDLRERVVGRLLWLRVMAPAASALGLAGAAAQAAWARQPPGLLALDPDRVLGMAASDGALCLALGIAGSTTALAGLFFLRSRALELLAGADRIAESVRLTPDASWTTTASK